MIWLINVSYMLILIMRLKHIQRKSIVGPCKYATYNSNLHTFTTITVQSSNGKLFLFRSIKSFRTFIKHRKVPAHDSRIKSFNILFWCVYVCVCVTTQHFPKITTRYQKQLEQRKAELHMPSYIVGSSSCCQQAEAGDVLKPSLPWKIIHRVLNPQILYFLQ